MSSVFTSRVTQSIPIPHDPGQSVTIRKLAPKHLRAARESRQAADFEETKRQIAITQALGDEVIKAVKGIKESEADGEKPITRVVDPLGPYDVTALCVSAIKAWSYADIKPAPDTIADLDEQTQEFIAREALKLSKPELFQSEDEQEAAQKNG